MSSPLPKPPASAVAARALIDRFLATVPTLTTAQRAAKIGVDPALVALWEKGEYPKKQLSGSMERSITVHLLRSEGRGGVADALDHLDAAAQSLEAARAALATPLDVETEGRASLDAAHGRAKAPPKRRAAGGRRPR